MNTAERHYEVQRWLRFASEDLASAEQLLNQSEAIPRMFVGSVNKPPRKL